MNCPQCHQPMTQVGRFWICGEHGPLGSEPIAPAPVPPPRSPQFDRLPSVLAIPLGEYAHETHPVMRLHRLCDSVEILTRFSFIVELGELRKRLGDNPFPEPLARALPDQIERPTLGQWKNLLQVTAEALSRTDPLVVPELREFVLGELIPGLERGPQSRKGKKKSDEVGLIGLRNNLVHGGAMTRAEAAWQLEVWEPWLNDRIERLDFLAKADLCYMSDGVARLLIGTKAEVTTERPLPADLRLALEACDRHAVLIHQGRWVDLWPLCDYGRAERSTGNGSPKAKADSPMVYIRAERDRLLYVALGADLPHSENRDGDIVAQFQALFALKDRVKLDQGDANDFEADLRRDSSALVGRVGEMEQAVDLLKRTQSGVLWLSGKGGIGKSFFTARLVSDPHLTGDSKKVCRIAWRFQASDQNRCNRVAFFRHAVTRLEEWLHGTKDFNATRDPGPLFTHLQGLLDEAAAREAAPYPNARAPRVVFVLDGLDEIARSDPDFSSVPFLLSRTNVVWLCAGRPEGDLPARFTPDRCVPVFPDGLPSMSDDDIRGMLLQGSDRLKYDLLGLDREQAAGDKTTVTNAAVEAVVARAAGLPLYVRFVIQDLLADEYRVDALDRLPPSLNAYYDELLKRLGIGDLQAILTPLIATIAWARAPLDEETLHVLMSRRKLFLDPVKGQALIRRALDAAQAMLKLAPIPGTDRLGYEPYHPTLRDHIRADQAGIIGEQNALAQNELCGLVGDWDQLPPNHPALAYVLRHGPLTLIEESRWDDLATLWLDPDRGLFFLEAKAEAGMVFDLVLDFGKARRNLSSEHSSSRFLRLLEQALRYDVHFLARHPTTVFQCLWNRGWWYDSDEAAVHYQFPPEGWPPEGPPWDRPEPRLCTLLQSWHQAKEKRSPGYSWVRSMRPLRLILGGNLQAMFQGHESSVWSVAFSPDGRRVASGSMDNTVRVWDIETGAQIVLLVGHQKFVTSVAFSLDGRRVVSGSKDKTVRVWDAETGAQIAQLVGHGSTVRSVAFSLDGRRVVSGSKDKTVRVWDAETGAQITRLVGHGRAVESIAFAPDGRRVVSGSKDKTLRVWDVETGAQIARLVGHGSVVQSVAFSPDGRRVVSGSDSTVRVWDAETGALIAQLVSHARSVESVGFSPDGRCVVSGSSGKTAWLWDAATGDTIARLFVYEGLSGIFAFAPDGRSVVSGSDDKRVRLWDADAGSPIGQLLGHEGSVGSITFSPDGRRVVSGSSDKTVRIWDADTGVQIAQLEGHGSAVQSVAFSPDGQRIVSGSRDKTVWVWDAETGAQLVRLDGHEDSVARVAFSPDGRRVLCETHGWTIRDWDNKTGGWKIRDWDNETTMYNDKMGRIWYPGTTVRIWDAETGSPIARLNGHVGSLSDLAFSVGGRRIVSGSDDKTLRVWDAETCAPIARLVGHEGEAISFAFTTDGRRIVSGSRDETARVWDAESGAQLARLDGHENYVMSVAFSPDGRRVVSGSIDSTLRVWDAESGVPVALLDGHENGVWSVGFSSDGRRIVSSSADDTVRIWDAETGTCLEVIPGEGDIWAIVNGPRSPFFRATNRGLETVIEAPSIAAGVAWFSDALGGITSYPNGRVWAGKVSNHLFLIRLEGTVLIT